MPQNGFSLIELMIAIAIIILGIAIVLQIFPGSFSMEKNTEWQTKAVFCAQEKMEALLALSFAELTPGTTQENPVPTPACQDFSRTTKISYVDANLNETANPTSLKKIEIKMQWNSVLKIAPNEVSFVTLFAEK
jgi:prepilin-type N-terminal cleavage/methylation domain-containing protein